MSLALMAVVALVLFAYVFSRSDSAPDITPAANTEEGGFSVSESVNIGGSIPQPNSGTAPENPGDRGGYLQLGLLAIIVGGIGFIGYRVVQGGKQNLATAAANPPPS